MNKFLIYFKTEEQGTDWYHSLMSYATHTKIGIVTGYLPIIGNLSVLENILLPAQYHHRMSYEKGYKLISDDLNTFGMIQHLHARSNQLNDFEKFIVKFLQIKYLAPEWFVIFCPRRMFVAEHENSFHNFLRCEDMKKSVIIDHENNSYMFSDLKDYIIKDFEQWVTQDLKI